MSWPDVQQYYKHGLKCLNEFSLPLLLLLTACLGGSQETACNTAADTVTYKGFAQKMEVSSQGHMLLRQVARSPACVCQGQGGHGLPAGRRAGKRLWAACFCQ